MHINNNNSNNNKHYKLIIIHTYIYICYLNGMASVKYFAL